jgi:hypothetical protein
MVSLVDCLPLSMNAVKQFKFPHSDFGRRLGASLGQAAGLMGIETTHVSVRRELQSEKGGVGRGLAVWRP